MRSGLSQIYEVIDKRVTKIYLNAVASIKHYAPKIWDQAIIEKVSHEIFFLEENFTPLRNYDPFYKSR